MEELLAERGIETSYETVRRWVMKFGPAFARNLRQLRPRPSNTWHLDEMVVSIQGRRMYLWRAVDSEGEVLDRLVQPKRDTKAALRLMRKLLKKQGFAPDEFVTDKLGSYGAARRELRLSCRHEQMCERPVGTVWLEETNNGVVLHMRVGTGADVMLTLPNASVAAQAEAQLRSVLAMATMQFQRVAKETTSGGTLWEGFMPEMVSRARGRLSAWG